MILLPHPPQCLDYRREPLHPEIDILLNMQVKVCKRIFIAKVFVMAKKYMKKKPSVHF
jgi:hypothetical protein